MSVEAQLSDGTVLVFPDGTHPDVVRKTVKRQLGLAGPVAPEATAPEPYVAGGPETFEPGQMQEPAAPGTGRSVMEGFVAKPSSFVAKPTEPVEKPPPTVEQFRRVIGAKYLTQPTPDEMVQNALTAPRPEPETAPIMESVKAMPAVAVASTGQAMADMPRALTNLDGRIEQMQLLRDDLAGRATMGVPYVRPDYGGMQDTTDTQRAIYTKGKTYQEELAQVDQRIARMTQDRNQSAGISQNFQRDIVDATPKNQGMGGKVLTSIAGSAVPALGRLAVGMAAGPLVGAAVMGAPVYGQTYAQTIEHGDTARRIVPEFKAQLTPGAKERYIDSILQDKYADTPFATDAKRVKDTLAEIRDREQIGNISQSAARQMRERAFASFERNMGTIAERATAGAAVWGGIIDSALEIAGERVGLGVILKQGTPALLRIFHSLVAEGGQEIVTQIGQTLRQILAYDPTITFKQALEQVAIAGLAGAAMGGPMGAVGAVADRSREQYDKKQAGKDLFSTVEGAQFSPEATDARVRASMDPSQAQREVVSRPAPPARATPGTIGDLSAVMADPRPLEEIRAEQAAQATEEAAPAVQAVAQAAVERVAAEQARVDAASDALGVPAEGEYGTMTRYDGTTARVQVLYRYEDGATVLNPEGDIEEVAYSDTKFGAAPLDGEAAQPVSNDVMADAQAAPNLPQRQALPEQPSGSANIPLPAFGGGDSLDTTSIEGAPDRSIIDAQPQADLLDRQAVFRKHEAGGTPDTGAAGIAGKDNGHGTIVAQKPGEQNAIPTVPEGEQETPAGEQPAAEAGAGERTIDKAGPPGTAELAAQEGADGQGAGDRPVSRPQVDRFKQPRRNAFMGKRGLFHIDLPDVRSASAFDIGARYSAMARADESETKRAARIAQARDMAQQLGRQMGMTEKEVLDAAVEYRARALDGVRALGGYTGADEAARDYAAPKFDGLKPTKAAPALEATGGRPATGGELIGKNADGQDVYEDARGVRSIVEDGVRVSQAVEMVPTRGANGSVVYKVKPVGENKMFVVAPAAAKASEGSGGTLDNGAADQNIDASDLDGLEGWNGIGYISGRNDGVMYDVDMRDIRQSEDGLDRAIRQIRIYDNNVGSHMAAWEWKSSKLSSIADLKIDLSIFHYVLSDRTERAFGEYASDGDALWGEYGPKILQMVREFKPEAPNAKPDDVVGQRPGDNGVPQPQVKLGDSVTTHNLNGTGLWATGEIVSIRGGRPLVKVEVIRQPDGGNAGTSAVGRPELGKTMPMTEDWQPRQAKKPVTPQVPAMPGMTPIGAAPTKGTLIPKRRPDGSIEWTTAPVVEKPAAAPKPTYGETNTVFTQTAAEAARERLKKKLGQVNVGIDPEMMQDGITLAGYHIEAGARTFAQFTKAMVADLGEKIRPYLKGWYLAVRNWPGFDNTGMQTEAEIEKGTTDELQTSTGGPEQQQEPAAAPGAAKGGETGPVLEPGGKGVEGAGGKTVPADTGAGQGEGPKPAAEGKPRPERGEGTGAAGAERPSLNYRITPEDKIGQSGWRQKALDNVAAVKIIKVIEKDNRPATEEEKKKLVKWVGWGASELANGMFPKMQYNYNTRKSDEVYKEGWEDLAKQLRTILTDDEYESARESTQNAHYTSPAIIQGIYSGLKHIGFRGGRMLEPGSGPGHFIGMQPEDLAGKIQFTGVELDPITAKVAKALYPESRIENVDFTEFKRPDGFFDGTVGNPPFASTIISADEKYAKFKFSLHDYFVAKAVDLTAPGGPIVLITSRYTMDKMDDKARAYLMTKADLIGAIRLPQTAFKQNAGTEVVTDVLFFRKRKDGELASGPAWRELKEVKTKEGLTKINEYFADNPDMVLGKHAMTGSMYGKNEYTVEPIGNIEEQFAKAVLNLPQDIIAPPTKVEASEPDIAPDALTENSFYYTANKVLQKRNGIGVDAGLSAVEKNKVRGLILIRQSVLQTIKAQLDGQDATEHRKTLNSVYDYFVKTYGPINKEVVSTRRITKGKYAGQESVSVKTPNFDAFKSDPHAYRVASIEAYDPETGKATKREIFTQDVINPYVEPKIENAVDALHVTVHQIGKVDINAVAEAAGVPVPVAIDTLADAIYMNPESKDWELAETYLAGPVRKKLKFAQAASMEDPSLARNVRALESVQPDDLPAARIHMSLGSPLIDTAYVQQFASEALGLERVRVEHIKKAALWLVTAPDNVVESERAISDWGIPDRNAVELLSDALNSKGVRIYHTVVEKGQRKQVYSAVATQAALEKLSKIKAAFEAWWKEDDVRASAIARIYNDTNNDFVKPDYAGPHIDKLDFPGLATTKAPYKHQKRGAWRIVSAGNTYLAHSVGSGKTLASILAGAMLKRLGLKKKIMYVVHNATLRQFASEWLEAYPAAKILVADEENFSKEERNRFMGRIAAENWDAIIITQTAFKMIPVSPEQTEKFITGELDEMRLALAAAEGDRGRTKAIERVIKSLEQKLVKMLSQQGKDKGVTFEESGVDQLFVDEAHSYRKLDFGTNQINVKGINPVGSQQAVDLFVKVRYLESKSPGRSTVLMSGTPLTNTIGEIFNIQRVLQLPELEARGMHKFDAWSSSFGSMVTELEAQPSGAYKNVTRAGRFKNMRDLSRMWSAVGDVVHTRDLPYLNLPKVKGGGRQVVLGESTQVLKDYKKELDKRIKAIEGRRRPPQKGDDIILSVITDGRHAALDERYIDRNIAPNPESKLEKAITNVAQIYKDTESVKGTQMVFADLGMPGSEAIRGFSVYNRMRQGLIEKGIPADQIVFAQDFKTPDEKRRIFAKMNAGDVRVMIGSSDAMGTGVNAQQRIVWMHHLDADKYLPSNIEQREGRGIRQGNELGVIDGVGISVYITKGSYDEKMWQFIESKQRAIDQFLAGDLADDSMDDIDGAANQFAELKAMSSDNPLAMEKAGLDAEVSKLDNLYWAHRGDQARHKATIAEVKEDRPKVEKLIGELKAAVKTTPDLSGDKFVIDIGGKSYTSREEAGKAIFAKMREIGDALMAKIKAASEGERDKTVWAKTVAIGSIGGEKLSLRTDIAIRGDWTTGGYVTRNDVEIKILREDPVDYLYMDRTYVGYVPPLESIYLSEMQAASESGIVIRIVNNRTSYAQRLAQSEEFIAKLINRGKQAEERIGAPFIHEATLTEKRKRLEEVERMLMAEEQTETSAAAEQSVDDEDAAENADDPLEQSDGMPPGWIRIGDTIEFRRPLDRLLKTRPATGTGVVESVDQSEDGDTYITTEEGEVVRMADATLLEVDEDTRNENLDRLDRAKEDAGDKYATASRFSDRYLENADAIAEGVIAIAKKIAPQVNTEVVGQLFRVTEEGGKAEVAGRRRAAENLIQVALRYESPESTLRHEALHSFFDMDLLSGAEQRVLKAKAKEWREKYGIDKRYKHLAGDEVALGEEGMADAYGAYRGGEQFGGFIGSAFAKISRFLRRLGNFLQGMGFQTFEDVFARMESGEVGRREQAESTLPIKSAVGNRGTFDPNNPDIRYSAGETKDTAGTVPTRVMGVDDLVTERERMAPPEVSVGHAKSIFDEVGLYVVPRGNNMWDVENKTLEEGALDPAGERLLEALRREIRQQSFQPGSKNLASLIGSVAEYIASDENVGMSLPLRTKLYGVAQGERSHRGLMLGELAQVERDTLQRLSRNVEGALERVYAEHFGGGDWGAGKNDGTGAIEGTQEILDEILKEVRARFTDAELRQILDMGGAGQGTGLGAGNGPGMGPGLGAGAGPGMGPGEGPGIGPGLGPGEGPGLGPGAGPGEGPGLGPGAGPGLGAGLGPGEGPGMGPGAGPGMGPGEGPGLGGGSVSAGELATLVDQLAEATLRENGGRLYRKIEAIYKKKTEKTLDSLNESARINEAAQKIIEDLRQEGIEPKERPGKQKLTPIESLMLMVNPETAGRIDERIAEAIAQAERNAGIKATMDEADSDERATLQQEFDAGLQPTEEMIEQGMELEKFAHWRVLRETLLEYSPTTLKLVHQVLRGEFKGIRPIEANPPKAPDTRIDLAKLARAPEQEVHRVLDAHMQAIEDEMDLSGATPETLARVSAMIQRQVTADLEAAREKFRNKILRSPAAVKRAAMNKVDALGEWFNARLLEDPRMGIEAEVARVAAKSRVRRLLPTMGDLVKKVFSTPFFRQSELENRFGRQLSLAFGLPEDQRKVAEELFRKAFEEKFTQAKAKALAKVKKSLTVKQQKTIRKLPRLWERINQAVNAGAFDSVTVMQNIAQERGWTVPTARELIEIRTLSYKEQKLRELTTAERMTAERSGNVRDAESDREAATLTERAHLKRQAQALWLRWTAPLGWRTAEQRRNVARAINEVTSANLLLRPGFFVRQFIDVATQTAVFTPTRAVASALQIYRADKSAGRETRLWRDAGNALRDAYVQQVKALRAAMSAAKRGMAGRSETKNVEAILDNISIFDRSELKAAELAATGKTAQAFMLRMANYFAFAFHFSKAMDDLQGTLAEAQEMQARTVRELREHGLTPEEAQKQAAWVMGDTRLEFQLAVARAQQLMETSGMDATPALVNQAAWEVVKSRQYARIEALKLPADDFRAHNRLLRNLIGWNEREIGGFGGVIAGLGRSVTELFEGLGLPMPIARFSNAIGIGINRALTFTPFGFTRWAFTAGKDKDNKWTFSPWYTGEENIRQRKIEAAIGSTMGLTVMALVAAGLMIPRFKWPENEAERDLWRRIGRQPGTVEIKTWNDSFITVSMTVGPLALVRPYLVFMGSINESLAKHDEQVKKLKRKAEEAGLQPAMAEKKKADILAAAASAMWSTFLGGRTAAGLITNITDNRAPQIGRSIAGTVAPLIPGAPQWQEWSRMQGVQLDPKKAEFLDFLFPTSGTEAEKRNFFGDPLNEETAARVAKVLTGGTYPYASTPISKNTERAYQILGETGWRPPALQNQAHEIGDQWRVFDSEEFAAYQKLRGPALKQAILEADLTGLTPNEKLDTLDEAAQVANEQAKDDVIEWIVRRTRGTGASKKIPVLTQ